MMLKSGVAGPLALALLLGGGQAACKAKPPASEEQSAPVETMEAGNLETSAATPAITRASSETPRDTPPSGAAKPTAKPAPGGAAKLSKVEYEGWRQYSVNCARCHGQDVLPNPVAANLLISLAPGGPIDTEPKFIQVVTEGRPDRGMPGFKSILTPDQIKAVYAYVQGRAEKRIPPGRPEEPA